LSEVTRKSTRKALSRFNGFSSKTVEGS